MRRTDRKITTEQSIHILNKCEYGILSTVDQDGHPYGVPVSYVYVGGSIYFHSACQGHKLDNLACNSKVAFSVVGQKQTIPEKFSTSYESVIVFGHAGQVYGQEKMAVLQALVNKYAPGHVIAGQAYVQKSGEQTVVVKITIEHMTGKARPLWDCRHWMLNKEDVGRNGSARAGD